MPPLVTLNQLYTVMPPFMVSPVLAAALCYTFPQINLRLSEELYN